MVQSDKQLLSNFIDDLCERMGCAGCNDFEMDDTEDNREVYKAAYADEGRDFPVSVHGGKILCHDFVILRELQKRMMQS